MFSLPRDFVAAVVDRRLARYIQTPEICGPGCRRHCIIVPVLLRYCASVGEISVMVPRSIGFPNPTGGLPLPSDAGPGPIGSQKLPSKSIACGQSSPQCV